MPLTGAKLSRRERVVAVCGGGGGGGAYGDEKTSLCEAKLAGAPAPLEPDSEADQGVA